MNDLEKNHKRQIDRLSINKYPVVTDAESYKKAKKSKKSYWISFKKGGTKMPSPKDTHGPIVKTGPTAGENRSRNQDGTWRKKRNDSGKKRKLQ